MVIKLNLNTALVVLGGLGLFAPDAAFIATWLTHWNIHWLTYVAKIFGFLAVFFTAAPLAVPKLRAFLALFKLATPAGEMVPHPEVKQPPVDLNATPPPVSKEAGYILSGRLLLLLGFALLFMLAWFFPKYARAEETTAASPVPTVAPALTTAAMQPPAVAPALGPATPPPSPTPTAVSAATAPLPAAPASTPSSHIDQVYPEASPTPTPTYDSKYGGCKGNFCLAPALAIQAFQYVPSTGDTTGGVTFAGGYGLVWHTMIDLGLAFYAGVQYSRDKPFTAHGLAMINIANYVAFGPGFEMLGQPSGPAKFHLTICFAANWIPGLIAPK
jgi:hypothetical protein